MAWNLPDGCSDYDVDVAAGGYDEPEPEDPDNAVELCKRCRDWPCHCLRDWIESEEEDCIPEDESCPF